MARHSCSWRPHFTSDRRGVHHRNPRRRQWKANSNQEYHRIPVIAISARELALPRRYTIAPIQKHALITGCSRGIGRGIALKFAEGGTNVAVHYFRNDSAAKNTLEEVRRRGAKGFVIQADICRPEEIAQMFQAVKAQFGKLDIFVSNSRPEAAEFFYAAMDITPRQWDAASDSQAKAFLIATRESECADVGGRADTCDYVRAGEPGRRPAALGSDVIHPA